eukprot:GHVL01035852.1.p1 GENE.GHVL01035852.1~~GHVL01035852.1.p1  ORF type:complete len:104 (+),score=18.45 GHVL01035852.1:849-1160(+)
MERSHHPDNEYGFETKFINFWSKYWTDVKKKFEEMADEVKGDELWYHEKKDEREYSTNFQLLSEQIMRWLPGEKLRYNIRVEGTKRAIKQLTTFMSSIRVSCV